MIKKVIFVLLIGLVSLMAVSCKQANEVSNKELYIGHIIIEKNTLHLDEIEWITFDNQNRIDELNLSILDDMPNGYYIYNPSSNIVSFRINKQTVYNFIDWGNDFVGEDEDRYYSTRKKEEFIKYLNTYSDKGAQVPFWVETKYGYIISITEQFVN